MYQRIPAVGVLRQAEDGQSGVVSAQGVVDGSETFEPRIEPVPAFFTAAIRVDDIGRAAERFIDRSERRP